MWHRGEVRFAVESSLGMAALLADETPRARAIELFASLGVWDTEENSGVLVYVLLADQRVEIVGCAKHVALLFPSDGGGPNELPDPVVFL